MSSCLKAKSATSCRSTTSSAPTLTFIAALRALKEQGHTLKIVANPTRQMIEDHSRFAGTLEFIDEIISSGDEVKAFKPSPRVFQLGIERAGCPKEEILWVTRFLGDHRRGTARPGDGVDEPCSPTKARDWRRSDLHDAQSSRARRRTGARARVGHCDHGGPDISARAASFGVRALPGGRTTGSSLASARDRSFLLLNGHIGPVPPARRGVQELKVRKFSNLGRCCGYDCHK